MAVVVAFIAAGYGGGDTAQKLDLARRSLLPPDADVIDEQRSQCRMLSADESCLMTLFVLKGGLRERERLIREAAESGGWKSAGEIRGSGGVQLSFKKDRDEAYVQLWPTPETDCHGASMMDCASYVDHAFVQQT